MASDDEVWVEEEIEETEKNIDIAVVPVFTGTRNLDGGCIGVVERKRYVNRVEQLEGSRCQKPGKKLICLGHGNQWEAYLSIGERTTLTGAVANAPMEGVARDILEDGFAAVQRGKEIAVAAEAARVKKALAREKARRTAEAGQKIVEDRNRLKEIEESGIDPEWQKVIDPAPGGRRKYQAAIESGGSEQVDRDLLRMRTEMNNMQREMQQLKESAHIFFAWQKQATNVIGRMFAWMLPKASKQESIDLSLAMGSLNMAEQQRVAMERANSLTGEMSALAM